MSSNHVKTIWLAKEDITHGPFSAEQIEALKMAGALAQYEWIKDSEKDDWRAIEAAPAPAAVVAAPAAPQAPPAPKAPSAPQAAAPKADSPPVARRAAPSPAANLAVWEVLCHDFRSVASARISRANDEGCDLVSSTPSGDPMFARQSIVLLNLLDAQSGRTIEVRARLSEAWRKDGQWVYKVRWQGEMPAELAAA